MNGFGPRQKQSLFVLCLMIAGMVYVSMRQEAGPEERARAIVKELVKAAENKDVGPFEEHLADRFKDDKGRDKQEVMSLLRLIYLKHPRIGLSIAGIHIQDSSDAQVIEMELDLLMSETSLPTDRGRFWITFRDQGGDLKVWDVVWEDGYGY